jgi:hypothetical protein
MRAQRDGGQDQALQPAAAGGRQPSELDRDDEDQHDPHPEVRRRLAHDGKRHGRHVDHASAVDGGQDAERQREGNGEQERGTGQLEGCRQPLEDERQRGLLMAERRAEIAAQGAAEELDVLQPQRSVEAELTAERSQLVDRCVAGQHGGRGVAGQAQGGEDESDDAESHEGGVENLAKNVAHHL